MSHIGDIPSMHENWIEGGKYIDLKREVVYMNMGVGHIAMVYDILTDCWQSSVCLFINRSSCVWPAIVVHVWGWCPDVRLCCSHLQASYQWENWVSKFLSNVVKFYWTIQSFIDVPYPICIINAKTFFINLIFNFRHTSRCTSVTPSSETPGELLIGK